MSDSTGPVLPRFELPEHRARRYADALAAAAAADARVEELTEKLATSDWMMQQAEMTVDAYKEIVKLGAHTLIDSTDPEPKVRALLSLWSGRVWVHPTTRDGEEQPDWIMLHRDPSGQTRYAWPIQDEGPFIGICDAWDLIKQNETAREIDNRDKNIRDFLRRWDGYRDPDRGYSEPKLEDALVRVVAKQQERGDEKTVALGEAKMQIRELEREIERLKEIAEERDLEIAALVSQGGDPHANG